MLPIDITDRVVIISITVSPRRCKHPETLFSFYPFISESWDQQGPTFKKWQQHPQHVNRRLVQVFKEEPVAVRHGLQYGTVPPIKESGYFGAAVRAED